MVRAPAKVQLGWAAGREAFSPGALTLGDNASISITGDTASRYTGALTLSLIHI